MRNRPWTDSDTQKLIDFYETHSEHVIGKELGRTLNAIQFKIRELAKKGILRKRTQSETKGALVSAQNDLIVGLPEPFTKCLKSNDEKSINICDLHVPFQDDDLIDMTCDVAVKQGIKKLNIGGDISDQEYFSHFTAVIKNPAEAQKQCRLAIKKVFDKLLKVFNSIDVFLSNHDNRVLKISNGNTDPLEYTEHYLMSGVDKKNMRFSSYQFMEVNDWMLVHPDRTSGGFLIEGKRIAAKFQKNVLFEHVHKCGETCDVSGKWRVVGGMAMLVPERIEYYMKKISGADRWQTGINILYEYGKRCVSLEKQFGDWNLWTKKRIL